MELTSLDSSILTVVVQSKQTHHLLAQNPVDGAEDPLPRAKSLLERASEYARQMGSVIIGSADVDSVSEEVKRAAHEFEAKLQG